MPDSVYALDLPSEPRCLARHVGPWMIEPSWFRQALSAVRAHAWPMAQGEPQAAYGDGPGYTITNPGIAVVRLVGQMQKGPSKFGGTDTIQVRRALRNAVQDEAVRGILLAVDSPGGTVAGTADLADDVRAAAMRKPLHAYVEDMGASAAYWVASQAQRITAGRTAEIGSIGTVAVVEDASEAYAAAGVKIHVVSTGPHKGAFADGAPVEPEHLAELQTMVNDLNSHFIAAIKQGRNVPVETARDWADGRVHIAAKAHKLGMIDAVGDFNAAFKALSAALPRPQAARPRADYERDVKLLELND